MLNIYYVDFAPTDTVNGITSYTFQYLSGIVKKKGFNLSCIWLNASDSFTRTQPNLDDITHFNFPKYHVELYPNVTESEWTANLILNLITGGNPIIHLNWLHHVEIIKHLRWRIDFKVVLTKHCIPWRDLVTDDYIKFTQINERFKKGIRMSSLSTFYLKELSAYDYVDQIITVTNIAKNSLTNLFSYDRKQISVIANGLNFEKTFKPKYCERNALRKNYGFHAKDKLILFVGTVSVRKGISALIESFNLLLKEPKCSGTKLIVIGKGDYSLLLSYPNIASKIVITGSLPKERLIDFYRMADVGVIPSYVEQCSYTAIEMMYAKLPIVATDIDGLKEMIKKEYGTLVPVDLPKSGNASVNIIELKNSMLFALGNRNIVVAKANCAFENAIVQFSLPTMIDKTVSVYETLNRSKNSRSVYFNQINLPKVSIILPIFNGQDYIRECINSVLAQTYQNFELIVIDDASTDRSWEIITSFKDNRIRTLSNKINRGITYSLNRALKLSTGEYISRIDADDKMLSNRLHEQVYFLESDKEYAMVGSWYEVVDKDGSHINIARPMCDYRDLHFLLLFANQFAHPSVTSRASVIKKLQYRSCYKHCEDYDLWFRVAAEYKTGNLPIILTKYRLHHNNVSVRFYDSQKYNSITLITDKLVELGIEATADELKTHLAIIMKLGIKYFSSGDNFLKLDNWLNKLLSCPIFAKNHDDLKREELKKFVANSYCFSSSNDRVQFNKL